MCYVANQLLQTGANVIAASVQTAKDAWKNTEVAIYGKAEAKVTAGAGGATEVKGLGIDARYRHVELLSVGVEVDEKKGFSGSFGFANKDGQIKEMSTGSAEFIAGGGYTLENSRDINGKISSKSEIDLGVAYGAAPTPAGALPVAAGMKLSRERNRQGTIYEGRGEVLRTGAKIGTPFTMSFDASFGIRATYLRSDE